MNSIILKIVFIAFMSWMNSALGSCVDFASKEFSINPSIVHAIIKTESNFDTRAININKNNTWDIGLMQINTIHKEELNRNGIKLSDLLDPCKNIIVGTWLLRRSIDAANGDVWTGVGYYHSLTPELAFRYSERVKENYLKS